MKKDISRRNFVKKSSMGLIGGAVLLSTSAKSYANIIGANDRINIALQGLGRRYPAYIESITKKESNVNLMYLCDVMESRSESAAKRFEKEITYKPKLEKDIRKVLEDKDLDAVFIATPDHWHTPGTIMAMSAGKHVYVEKPCSHNLRENELIVKYQKKYNKVVQMGNQLRSSLELQEVIKKIHNGVIGEPYKAIAPYVNHRGKVPVAKKVPVPAGFDWELFQGPAPRKDYIDTIWDYNWHWYGWDYGTAEAGNNAIHGLDVARWALQLDYPEHVDVFSGKFQYPNDGWEMYDTMVATFRFSNNKTLVWDQSSRNGHKKFTTARGTIIYGSEGSAHLGRSGYKLYNLKGKLIKEKNTVGDKSSTGLGGGGSLSTRHAANFYETIRGNESLRSPINEGAVSQVLTHYANIAHRIGKSLEIDENTGRIFDRDAMKLWGREYEPGWEI